MQIRDVVRIVAVSMVGIASGFWIATVNGDPVAARPLKYHCAVDSYCGLVNCRATKCNCCFASRANWVCCQDMPCDQCILVAPTPPPPYQPAPTP